jgi:hypothetical protein
MSQPETRSLHRKLAQIMYEAERIPKNGIAPREMGGFGFVQVGDAADYVRKALGEKVISMLPTKVTILGQTEHATKSGGSVTVVDLITEWTLTDGESGESITIESFGAGADSGDKYSGKAQTNAMKYALLMGFLLSTGDDPELGDGAERRTVQEAPERSQMRAASSPALPDHTDRVVAQARADEPPGPWEQARAVFADDTPVYKAGDRHDPTHNPLKVNAKGLFCPTKVGDGWCDWRPDR